MKQCLEYQCFTVCEPRAAGNSTYYILNAKNIFFIKNGYHRFFLKETKWHCSNCPGGCQQKIVFEIILKSLDVIPKQQVKLDYSTVSSLPIPLTLDPILVEVYKRQLSCGLNLPENLYPEREFCGHGYKFNTKENLVLERTGIIIYTENEVLNLNRHHGMFNLVNVYVAVHMHLITKSQTRNAFGLKRIWTATSVWYK